MKDERVDRDGNRWAPIDGKHQRIVPTYRRVLWKIAGRCWHTGGWIVPDSNKPPISGWEGLLIACFAAFMVWAWFATAPPEPGPERVAITCEPPS